MKLFSVSVNGSAFGRIKATSEAEAIAVFRIVNNSQVSKFDEVKATRV